MSDLEQRLATVLARTERDRELAGVVARVERPSSGFDWTGSRGNLERESPFFIASTTKLYTSATILRMAGRSKISLDDRLVDRVAPELVAGIHHYRGTDYTDRITIRHLLSHTSGIADYFQGKTPTGATLVDEIRSGRDSAWTLEDTIGWSREMGGQFSPGSGNKALYSDTNYQLLGRVIEEVSGSSYAETLRTEVYVPLGLEDTYVYNDPTDETPEPIRVGPEAVNVPRAMASFGPDGGIVATVDDLMAFLRAFFEGGLFEPHVIDTLTTYRRIFFPLEAGVGITRFRLPRIFSPFNAPPELVGHSGLSGAFAFLSPKHGVYLAGTVNNVAKPGRSFRMMLQLLREFDR